MSSLKFFVFRDTDEKRICTYFVLADQTDTDEEEMEEEEPDDEEDAATEKEEKEVL